jgi:geranylgeranyl transferase type-2 subunit alpha
MHGHKRAEYKARLCDPKVAAGLQHKANQWFKLNDQVLLMKERPNLELIANMLQVNPDPLYLWQKRRTGLLLSSSASPEISSFNLSEELTLTRKCLERNPKAYGAWFHRKWCLLQQRKQPTPNNTAPDNKVDEATVLQQELHLTEQFLNLDERNFHCWNYRRFLVGCLCGSTSGEIIVGDTVVFGSQVGNTNQEQSVEVEGGTPCPALIMDTNKIQALLDSEFDFTTQKIQQNFSNGSAFHYRSKLLPFLSATKFSLTDELELIHNAIFTEPDDQTAWWYYDYILTRYCDNSDEEHQPSDAIDLKSEKELLEELIDAEGGRTKWGLLALYKVLSLMKKDDGVEERQKEILTTLIDLDPDRCARYQDMWKRNAFTDQITL